MGTYHLTTITVASQAVYEVTFNDGERDVTFEMTVEGDDILVVTYGDDFTDFVGTITGPLGPVFKAVLDFHHATAIALPRPGQ